LNDFEGELRVFHSDLTQNFDANCFFKVDTLRYCGNKNSTNSENYNNKYVVYHNVDANNIGRNYIEGTAQLYLGKRGTRWILRNRTTR